MGKKITNKQLAQEIKSTGAEERRKILDKQNKLLTEKLREKIRQRQQEEDVQTIINDIFAEQPPEAQAGELTLFSADGVLGSARTYKKGALRQFINSHKKD